MKINFFTVIIWCKIYSETSSETYSSSISIRNLLVKERNFVKTLQEISRLPIEESVLLNSLLKFYPNITKVKEIDSDKIDKIIQNPISCLGVLRRLSEIKQEALEKGLGNTSNSVEAHLAKYLRNFPSQNEHLQYLHSLGTLQETYRFSIKDFSSGKIQIDGINEESDDALSWRELYTLGDIFAKEKVYDSGIDWMIQASQKVPKQNPEIKGRILTTIAKYQRLHDEQLEKYGPVSASHRTHAVPFDKQRRKSKKYKNIKKTSSFEVEMSKVKVDLYNESHNLGQYYHNFQFMCRDGSNSWRTPKMDMTFKCVHLHHEDPYLKLGPLKLEVAHFKPFIGLFHDFLYDSEMDHFINYSLNRLNVSEVGAGKGNRRISETAWLLDTTFQYPDNNFMDLPFQVLKYERVLDGTSKKVSLRISWATKLEAAKPLSREPYQIVNYGPGGLYSTHLDAFNESDWHVDHVGRSTGDRIITVMGYMSHVRAGGRTVFPSLGVTVKPERGMAVVWFNTKDDGQADALTHHGGCPVVIGSKWITNKWLHQFDQFNEYPCSIKEGQRIDIKKHWKISY